MSRKVVITGTSIVSPLGDSPESVHAALCAGRVAMSPIEGFETPAIQNALAGEVKDFNPAGYFGRRNLRPLDRTSRLLTVAAQLALTNSGWTPELIEESEVGLAVGTMFCGAHTISDFDVRALKEGPNRASPLDFANTVINAAAGQAALWHKLRGPNTTVSAGSTSGLQAIAYAFDLVRNGRVRAVLTGGVEELCYETYFGFYNSGALCNSAGKEHPLPVPFDRRRNGFLVSEGAALLMLEDEQSAISRGATILGEVKGYGNSFDSQSCSRRGDDSTHSAAAIGRSILAALEDASITADQINAVSASGNGSESTDRGEAASIAETFGKSANVTAIKSMLGESLGASGAMQTVAMLESMKDGKLPGIAGLEQVEDGLAADAAQTRNVEIKQALINSVGLDGNTSSLVIGETS